MTRLSCRSGDMLLWPLARQLQAGRPLQPVCPARAHVVAVAPEKDADAAIAVRGYCADSSLIRSTAGTSLAAVATPVDHAPGHT
jgi:hypothetical protein